MVNDTESNLKVADESTVTTQAVVSQLLFKAGHSLTTGGFYYYFVNEFHPIGQMMALLQVTPETAALVGSCARSIVQKLHTRKWVWVGFVVFSRLAAILVPLTLFLRGYVSDQSCLNFILIATFLWSASQGVAFVTYLSWLSVLVSRQHWGRLFAKWEIASLVVSIVVPTAVGLFRSRVLQSLAKDWQTWSYGVIFGLGGLIVMASILPMLAVPDETNSGTSSATPQKRKQLFESLLAPNYRWFVLQAWWLAFFQGLTQSVIFLYQTRVLNISLEMYYVLNGTMLLLQIPFSALGGYLSERNYERNTLIASLLAVSCAMGFYLTSTPERWWMLWGAYIFWGLFGTINVCLRSLNLKLAPAGDNTLHLSIVTQWGGAFAAFAGVLGGWWLDALAGEKLSPTSNLIPFYLIFAVSWLGRATAALWLYCVREPVEPHT